MDHQVYKEVYFDKYCKSCVYTKLKETDSPCDECMCEPINLDTHRPVKYVKKETK